MKKGLYADHVLFFLGDTGSSLEKVMHIVEEFGNFSGLSINWEKSSLLPVDPLDDSTSVGIPQLKITEKMKYLGIVLFKDPNLFIEDNLAPLLLKFKKKCDIWSRLPLSVAGRANLGKMIWLPQLLYLFHNSPTWIGEKWFQKIQALFRELIWKKGQARIAMQTLQRPDTEGGFGIPYPFGYYLAAQLQQLG